MVATQDAFYKLFGAGLVKDLTLSLDTNAYAEGDVLADRQEITNVLPGGVDCGVIQSVTLLDEDDNGRAIELIFLDSDVTIGTENSAVSITDANARKIVGRLNIAATDYSDLINSQFAQIRNVGIQFQLASGSTSLWVAAVYRDETGDTYTAAGIRLKLGILPC